MVHPNIQIDYPNSMSEINKRDPNSPMFTLASVSAELLKEATHEIVPTPAQGMKPKRQISSIDLEIPSRELSPPPDPKQPAEPSTPNQPTIGQLTQELAQSMSRNEEYAKLIAEIWQENKDLHLQVKAVEDLNLGYKFIT